MSRPNTPNMDNNHDDSSEDLSREIEDEYPDTNDWEPNRTLHSSVDNRSSTRSPTRTNGGHHITIPAMNNAQRTSPTSCGSRSRSMTSVEEMMEELIGDINTMLTGAADIVETANQIRTVVHHTLDGIDLQSPAVSQLGLAGTIKDLRRETVRTVVDADRAHLRYRKVLTEFLQLRRCLRRLGVVPSRSSYGANYSHGSAGRSNYCSVSPYRDIIDDIGHL